MFQFFFHPCVIITFCLSVFIFICLFPNFEIDIFVHWLFTTSSLLYVSNVNFQSSKRRSINLLFSAYEPKRRTSIVTPFHDCLYRIITGAVVNLVVVANNHASIVAPFHDCLYRIIIGVVVNLSLFIVIVSEHSFHYSIHKSLCSNFIATTRTVI